ncbi:NAD(P)H-dependent oxidoreductase [Mucilaginibacter sp.]|uniref:NAD(P)H-dependent oxidoreductase n=1 Tax=Mucilaginibacter sp. TaxID=1882438 RepID=UPI0035BC49B0
MSLLLIALLIFIDEMKQVVIINADIDKSDTTRVLIDSYNRGARQGGSHIKEIIIANLKFNPNKSIPERLVGPEPDLVDAIDTIRWASHIAIFCPVYKSSINFKIKGFFERVFLPDQVFMVHQGRFSNDFSGRSARIISILDEDAWNDWRLNQRQTYLPIKRRVLEKCNFKPVHTSTIGYLQSVDNKYSKKWLNKLHDFGTKLI